VVIAASIFTAHVNTATIFTAMSFTALQIEVKLKKASSIRWSALEGDGSREAAVVMMESAEDVSAKAKATPRSGRDWDALVVDIKKEESEEKPEGDAALNALFKQIYGSGTARYASVSGPASPR